MCRKSPSSRLLSWAKASLQLNEPAWPCSVCRCLLCGQRATSQGTSSHRHASHCTRRGARTPGRAINASLLPQRRAPRCSVRPHDSTSSGSTAGHERSSQAHDDCGAHLAAGARRADAQLAGKRPLEPPEAFEGRGRCRNARVLVGGRRNRLRRSCSLLLGGGDGLVRRGARGHGVEVTLSLLLPLPLSSSSSNSWVGRAYLHFRRAR